MQAYQNEFSSATRELLAKRVCYRCSNPKCRKPTSGPAADEKKTVTNGEAAHICAASPGGKRYDPRMTPEQRRSVSNGIWLCRNCHKLIDSDALRYPVELLLQWKSQAEEQAFVELECRNVLDTMEEGVKYMWEDVNRMRFYIQCIDRPAFHDHLSGAGAIRSMPFHSNEAGLAFRNHDRNLCAFEQAIQDTIIALNTGILRTRDGDVLMRSQGKSQIVDPVWNQKMKKIVEILMWMRQSLSERRQRGVEPELDRKFLQDLEEARQQVVQIINSICRDIGLNELDG